LIFRWSCDNIDKFGIVIPISMWVIWCARNVKTNDDMSTPLVESLSKIKVMIRDVTSRRFKFG